MSSVSEEKSPVLPNDRAKSNWIQRRFPWLYALWKFSRPHTIIGTTLSALGVYLIAWSALGDRALPPVGWVSLVLSWLACICGNVYIVGLNQLEDVAIDKVNKPHLPLASGEFSRRQAVQIVAIAGIAALALSAMQGYFLMAMVWVSLLIGTAYSLPPVRLKRFPFWASVCIFTVRGAIVNLGLFLHFRQVLSDRQLWIWNQSQANLSAIPAEVWLLTAFILVFTFAIAIFKDIPDLEGDRRYNISTFTIRMGQKAVFNLARWILTGCYSGAIVFGVLIPGVNSLFLVLTHGVALAAFWWLSWRVDLTQKVEIAHFYQFIWKLFFLEYLLFPIACLFN